MNAAAYRRVRIATGGLVLVFCALAFADIGNWISAPVARAALWPQFAPSLLGLLHGAGWISAGCLAVILLTLLFGRVYCAMLCPLGVLMDLAAKLAGRTGRNRKLPFRKGKSWLRVLAVTVCAVGLLAGTALPLAFLDPYSVFGKIISATLRPSLAWMNHLLASAQLIHPVDVSPVAWTSVGVAVGLLAMVLIAAVYRGRLWCNTVCPVGAVLGFISKHALFRLRISDSACVACSMCERVCPAQCIDFKKHSIDHSRCVMCLDCVTSCKRSGISLTTKWRDKTGADGLWTAVKAQAPHRFGDCTLSPPNQSNPDTLEPAVMHAGLVSSTSPQSGDSRRSPKGRRLFIASAITIPAMVLAETGGRNRKGRSSDGDCRCDLNQHNTPPVLPPGARSLARFQSLCTACQLCVANCPDQVLRPSITRQGLAGFLQPYQDFDFAFCSYNCSDCSQICPTGAIQPVTIEERRTIRTGKAVFFKCRCVVKTEGTACGACSEHCPTQAVHMVPWKNGLTIPELDPDLCIGCGGCEFICPVRPEKAIIVSGLEVHERAKAVVSAKQNTVRTMEEEFPF